MGDDDGIRLREVVVDPVHVRQGSWARIYVEVPAVMFHEEASGGPDLIHGRVATATSSQESHAESHVT